MEIVDGIRRGVEYKKEARPIINETLNKIRRLKEKIIEIVKKYQPFDPTDPVNPQRPSQIFLKDLRISVCEKLEEKLKKEKLELDWDKIKVYTSTDTPLDVIGIDGFIIWEEDHKKIVTLDATLRKEKLWSLSGADVVFGEPPDPREDEKKYFDFIGDTAERITKILAA